MTEGIKQLAMVTSVLGGFSFTFLSAILTIKPSSKVKFWVIILLMIASMCFLLASLGWSMLSFDKEIESIKEQHQFLVKLLVFGLTFIISSIGLSGWLNDKKTGIATSLISVFSIIILFTMILNRYMN